MDAIPSEQTTVPATTSRIVASRRSAPAVGPERCYDRLSMTLIALLAVVSALRWSLYPVHVDSYYHMGTIEGFRQAGGVVTHAFWEMAPGGRPHIYPPSIHVAGYLASLVGVTGRDFVTFVSWAFYPLSLLTSWIWLRDLVGSRAAFYSVVLLCGPGAWFWNQTAHTANALAMVVAPLALLAIERDRFVACGVLTFVVIASHPMGLFLPPALAIHAVLRRKPLVPALLAVAAPVVLYGPWLAHVWANRSFLAADRVGGSIEIADRGVHLGLLAGAFALPGIVWVMVERRKALGLLGPALGFAVVLPMGFGGRFLVFNVHWVAAALGGLGAARLLAALERSPRRRRVGQLAAVAFPLLALATFPCLGGRPPPAGGPAPRPLDGAPRPRGLASGDRPGPDTRPREEARRERRPTDDPRRGPPSALGVRWQLSALVTLMDPGGRPEPGAGPGGGPRPEPRGKPGPGPARGPGPGPGGAERIHHPGADEFLEAIRTRVGPTALIDIDDPAGSALITGATGRWTTGGILHDVSASQDRARPADCEWWVTLGDAPSPADPSSPGVTSGAPAPAPAGEPVFRNDFGVLWRNLRAPEVRRPVPSPTLPMPILFALVSLGVALIVEDLVPRRVAGRTRVVPALGFALALACMLPLASTALGELRHPDHPVLAAGEEPGRAGS